MKRENQALRLAQMMQNRVTAYPSFGLALPPVELEHAKLKKLSKDDILLLGMDTLTFVLIEDENICANLVPRVIDERSYLEIINIDKEPLKTNNSKKYQNVLISFGKVRSRKIAIGFRIDITQRPLEYVTIMVEGNKYASASLVNVDGELAVKIEKVEI